MAKIIYTERDIEDLAKQGVTSLEVGDDVVLTDLARDKAGRLGIELVRDFDKPPSAPERPYITKLVSPSATSPVSPPSATVMWGTPAPKRASEDTHLSERVRAGVVARLGDSVDPKLLDTIIRRVLQKVDLKSSGT